MLEHLSRQESINLLKTLTTSLSPEQLSIIVTMPIISLFSIFTVKEFLTMIKNGQRPPTGLFDRTHQILTSARGHASIFQEAGYKVVETGFTNHTGVVGIAYSPVNPTETDLPGHSLALGLLQFATQRLIPKLLRPFGATAAGIVIKTLTEYQGVYVLQPKN